MLRRFFVGIVVLSSASTSYVQAQDALTVARRNFEFADIKLRQYAQVEYPTTQLRLDNEIKAMTAELAIQQRRIKELGPDSVFKYSEAFGVSLDEARRAALLAELRLRELRDERCLLERFKSDRYRLLQLELDAAREQVRALEKPPAPPL